MKLSPTIIELLETLSSSVEASENRALLQAIDNAIDEAINRDEAISADVAMARLKAGSVLSDEEFLELEPANGYFH